MEMQPHYLDILFGLIKFDMQQIQTYREAMLNVSILSIGASFAISAFLYGKENKLGAIRETILLTTNIGLVVIIIIVGYLYSCGLDGSRDALEMRETALKQLIDKGQQLTAASLYPDTRCYQRSISSFLEKLPIFLAPLIIIVKVMIEILVFRRRDGGSKDEQKLETQ